MARDEAGSPTERLLLSDGSIAPSAIATSITRRRSIAIAMITDSFLEGPTRGVEFGLANRSSQLTLLLVPTFLH